MIAAMFAAVVIYFFAAFIAWPVICGLVALYETVRDHRRLSKHIKKPGRDSGRL